MLMPVARRIGRCLRSNCPRLRSQHFALPKAWDDRDDNCLPHHRMPLPPTPLPQITASALHADLDPWMCLDVRTGLEYRWQHIPGAVQLQRPQILARIPKHQPIAVVCLSGHRSIPMTRWLMQQGYQQVSNLQGGFWRWWRAGYPTVSGSTPGPGDS